MKNKIAVIALHRDYERFCYDCNLNVPNDIFCHVPVADVMCGARYSGLIFVGDYQRVPDLRQLEDEVRARMVPDGD